MTHKLARFTPKKSMTDWHTYKLLIWFLPDVQETLCHDVVSYGCFTGQNETLENMEEWGR